MNNRFLAILYFCLFSTASLLRAQQIPLFTQYREMQGVINPATVNYDYFTDRYTTSIGATIRQQWSALTGSPATQILRGEHFMADRTGFAPLFGGYLMRDQTGPTGFTGIYGRFGGVFTSDPEFSGLSIALVGGAVQYRVNTSEIKLKDPSDIRAQEDRMQVYPDLGAGIFYYQRMDGVFDQDYFYAGLSVPQMFGLDLTFKTDDARQFQTRRVQHFYANVGWYHYLNDDSFIEPAAWVRYTPSAPLSIDLNVRYQMPNFWVGIGSSLGGNLHGEVGLIVGKNLGVERNIKIGYGFDYSFQSYAPYVGATHEVNLSVAF